MSNVAEERDVPLLIPLLYRIEKHTKRCRKSKKNCGMIKTDSIGEGSSFKLVY
jgi:hypothetical protein